MYLFLEHPHPGHVEKCVNHGCTEPRSEKNEWCEWHQETCESIESQKAKLRAAENNEPDCNV